MGCAGQSQPDGYMGGECCCCCSARCEVQTMTKSAERLAVATIFVIFVLAGMLVWAVLFFHVIL